MLSNLKNIFKVPDLRNKILFTMLCIAIYRLGAAIRVPGIDDQAVRALEAEGYAVRINQSVDVPLSQCTVLSVSGLRGTEDNGVLRDPGSLNVASIDVNCTPHS